MELGEMLLVLVLHRALVPISELVCVFWQPYVGATPVGEKATLHHQHPFLPQQIHLTLPHNRMHLLFLTATLLATTHPTLHICEFARGHHSAKQTADMLKFQN